LVNETKLGTLEFCGTVNFTGGTWAGVELDEAEGKHDGTVNGITYFNCEPGFGVMVPTNKIEKVKCYCNLTLR
jgi:dynactin complex subunit